MGRPKILEMERTKYRKRHRTDTRLVLLAILRFLSRKRNKKFQTGTKYNDSVDMRPGEISPYVSVPRPLPFYPKEIWFSTGRRPLIPVRGDIFDDILDIFFA